MVPVPGSAQLQIPQFCACFAYTPQQRIMSHSSVPGKYNGDNLPARENSTLTRTTEKSEKEDVRSEQYRSASSISSPRFATHHRDDSVIQDTPTTAPDVEEEYPRGWRLWSVIVALALATFLAALDMNIVATALPKVTDQFNALDDIGWFGSALFLTVASSQSVWGKAYKYVDLKTVFLVSIFVFELGSLISAVAQGSITFIVGRAIIGLGVAGVLAGCYTIIAFVVPPEKRPAFTGIMGATYGVSSVVGPLLGGAFTDGPGWRWCFYINLPIGGLAVAIIIFILKTPPGALSEEARNTPLAEKIKQMDLPGFFVVLGGVVCLLLAFEWGGVSKPWKSADVIGTIVGFGVITILFLVIEWCQGPRALLSPWILKRREVWTGCIFSFFIAGAFFILLYYLPIYFQAIRNTSAANSGVRNLALIIAITLFVIASGGFMTATGQFAILFPIGAVLTTVGSGLLYTLERESPSGVWIGYQIIAGVGIGLCFQAPIMAAQALSPPEDISSTTAQLLFFQTMGGAFMVSAAQSAFANELVSTIRRIAPQLNPAQVVATGATEIRVVFHGADLDAVLIAYMEGIRTALILCIALGGVATLVSPLVPWKSIKGKATLGAASV
ncbi:MFS multidrug transporter [Phyllosticta citricarpa]|uniref:MFS multidrug transporter n=1 Tax=Phyllosticta citricarpa TaxID=55181 RepID=A0ABR1LFV7_9PEZI